jgi:hypothetical protein
MEDVDIQAGLRKHYKKRDRKRHDEHTLAIPQHHLDFKEQD